MMLEKKTRSKKKKEKDLSPRSLSRICSNIFANDGEAEEVLGAIVNVVVVLLLMVVLLSLPFSPTALKTRKKLKNTNPKPYFFFL